MRAVLECDQKRNVYKTGTDNAAITALLTAAGNATLSLSRRLPPNFYLFNCGTNNKTFE